MTWAAYAQITFAGCPAVWKTAPQKGFGWKIFFSKSLFCTKAQASALKVPLRAGPYGLRLVYGQAFHEPAEFLSGKGPYLGGIPWPLEAAAVKSLLQQDEAIFVKVQRFEGIQFPSTEQIDRIGKRIHLIRIPDNGH